jgi:bacterial/archaeal transporter family protein
LQPLKIGKIDMWLLLAFLSATLLGFYDVFKKHSLSGNAVIPVLFLNTLFSSLIFLPFILVSYLSPSLLDQTMFFVPTVGWEVQKYIVLKSFIVLSSWILGYFGMKHLPLTIVGPINATRPVMVLVGALLFFGERLNLYQWIGVLLAIASFFLLSRSGKKEGIDFKHNKWIYSIVGAAVLGAISGLYDKYLMAPLSEGGIGLDRMVVQSWYNIYQFFMMGAMLILLWWPKHKQTTPFRWEWSILLISIFLSAADFVYFYSLSLDGAMISIVSMVRRSSVLVSFAFGAIWFHEKNLKNKAADLALVLIGMIFLYLGTR